MHYFLSIIAALVANLISATPLPQDNVLGSIPGPPQNNGGGLLGNLVGSVGNLLGGSPQAGGSNGGPTTGPQGGGLGGLLGGLTNTLGQALQPINASPQNIGAGGSQVQASQAASPQAAPLQVVSPPTQQQQSFSGAYVCVPVAQLEQLTAHQSQAALQPTPAAQAKSKPAQPESQPPPKSSGSSIQSTIPLGGFAPFTPSASKHHPSADAGQQEKQSSSAGQTQPSSSNVPDVSNAPTKPREPVHPKGVGQ